MYFLINNQNDKIKIFILRLFEPWYVILRQKKKEKLIIARKNISDDTSIQKPYLKRKKSLEPTLNVTSFN